MDDSKIFLIVDDDDDDIAFLKEAVHQSYPHAYCLSARNGEQALKLLENHTTRLPDIIFMDLNMPRMDGKTCLKKLKAQMRFQGIPVVIFSTSSSDKHKLETKKLGAAKFITKPTSFTILCKLLEDTVNEIIPEHKKKEREIGRSATPRFLNSE